MKRNLTLLMLILKSLFLLSGIAPNTHYEERNLEKTKRDEDHGTIAIYLQNKHSDIYGGTYTSIDGEKYFLLTEATPEIKKEIKGKSAYPDTFLIKKVQYSVKQLEAVKRKVSEAVDVLDLQGVGLDIENNKVVAITTTTPNAKNIDILKDNDPGIIHWKVNKEKSIYEPL
ncbi:hypothetical protein [Paenibacillus sp. LHD-38]|uniref:hypothetical protein n=1 Tax=Paenibacillus sp. LHD-38 TaxID=3072143 RepID=UPI00280F78A2|nr:hypothetical protein [Paenibacillus sp. LHD-38]MDQ8739389.1 hypothetical protein [Paenibacillus sp. LHD-38]